MKLVISGLILVWLFSLVPGLLSLIWSSSPHKRKAAWIASGLGLAIGLAGACFLEFSASSTVNGQTVWKLDSDWFFLVSAGLGAAGMLVLLLRRTPTPGFPPRIDPD